MNARWVQLSFCLSLFLSAATFALGLKVPQKAIPLGIQPRFDSIGDKTGLVDRSAGKTVAWAGAWQKGNTQWVYKFVLEGMNPDGTPDTSFGQSGIVDSCNTLGLDCNRDWHPLDVISDYEDGALYVLVDQEIVRLKADGSLDASFANQGVLELASATNKVQAQGIYLFDDGSLLATLNLTSGWSSSLYDKKSGKLLAGDIDFGFPKGFTGNLDNRPVFEPGGFGAVAGGGEQICTLDMKARKAVKCASHKNIVPGSEFNSSQPEILLLPDGNLLIAGASLTAPGMGQDQSGVHFIKVSRDLVPQTFGTNGALFIAGYYPTGMDNVEKILVRGNEVLALVSKQFAGWSHPDDEPGFFPVLYEFDLSGKLVSGFGDSGLLIPRPTVTGMLKDVLPKVGGLWTLGNSYPAEPLVARRLVLSDYEGQK